MSAPVGVAVVGCAHGPHAWSYARALAGSANAWLVGAYDEHPALAEPLARDFGAPVHTDPAVLVGSAEVQAVVVCSATAHDRRHVELAASLGRHVLCEKPIATTVEDATAMVAACDRAGVQLHTAFPSRFLPLVRQVRRVLQEGQIGDLLAAVAGNRGVPPLPPAYPDWITTPELSGGGALIDHSVHLTDVLRHLSGAEVTRVTAEVATRPGLAVEDLALLSLVFDSGMVASLDPSWSVPAGNPWDYDFYLRLLGTAGSLDLTDLAESLDLVSGSAGPGLRLAPFGDDVDATMIEAFVASVRTGAVQDPCATGVDGLRALEVALAGYASAAGGAPVRVTR